MANARVSTYITKEQSLALRENYIKTFGALAWDRLHARAMELEDLERQSQGGQNNGTI